MAATSDRVSTEQAQRRTEQEGEGRVRYQLQADLRQRAQRLEPLDRDDEERERAETDWREAVQRGQRREVRPLEQRLDERQSCRLDGDRGALRRQPSLAESTDLDDEAGQVEVGLAQRGDQDARTYDQDDADEADTGLFEAKGEECQQRGLDDQHAG